MAAPWAGLGPSLGWLVHPWVMGPPWWNVQVVFSAIEPSEPPPPSDTIFESESEDDNGYISSPDDSLALDSNGFPDADDDDDPSTKTLTSTPEGRRAEQRAGGAARWRRNNPSLSILSFLPPPLS